MTTQMEAENGGKGMSDFVTGLREIFVESMVDFELQNQAEQHGGALVTLTPEWEGEVRCGAGSIFDRRLQALKSEIWDECARKQRELTSIDSVTDELMLANPYKDAE